MADRRKLMAGILNLPESARKDLAQRAQDVEREGVVGMLRKATGEMYNNPIVNTAIGFTPGVGDVQAAGETFAALQRGAPWQETAGYAVGMLPFMPMIGKTVWHSSPHSFDAFDVKKMGSGVGNQAYLPGIYTSENMPYTQKEFMAPRSNSANANYMYKGQPVTDELEKSAAYNLSYFEGDKKAVLSQYPESYFKTKGGKQFKKFVNSMDYNEIKPAGYTYMVDLPDEKIANMLDWDKPLGKQPQVVKDFVSQNLEPFRKSLEETGELRMNPRYNIWTDATGRDFANAVRYPFDDKLDDVRDETMDFVRRMQEAGIPGNTYTTPTDDFGVVRNYVSFENELPQILERNGQPVAQALRDYRGAHTAPGPEFGAQLHDVTGGGAMYPEDIYSSRGASIYGHGGSDIGMDKETMRIIQQMRNKPEEMVDIYRAVPNEADISTINAGDWVTINPNYAKQHGESNLPEGYKILQQKVPAKSVWTNADSIHEYGYWPE